MNDYKIVQKQREACLLVKEIHTQYAWKIFLQGRDIVRNNKTAILQIGELNISKL